MLAQTAPSTLGPPRLLRTREPEGHFLERSQRALAPPPRGWEPSEIERVVGAGVWDVGGCGGGARLPEQVAENVPQMSRRAVVSRVKRRKTKTT